MVLSAPKGVTNALSLLCEQAASGADYGELLAKLGMTLNGIVDDLNSELRGFNQQRLHGFISEIIEELTRHLKGISLLNCAPDPIAAKILSMGEYVSVNIFSEILTSLGQSNQIVDPVTYVLAEGEYLDSIADVAASKARFSDLPRSKDQVPDHAGLCGCQRGRRKSDAWTQRLRLFCGHSGRLS